MLVERQLEPIEAERLLRKLPSEEGLRMTFNEIKSCVEELLEADLDDCIKWSYCRIDVSENKVLSIRPLK